MPLSACRLFPSEKGGLLSCVLASLAVLSHSRAICSDADNAWRDVDDALVAGRRFSSSLPNDKGPDSPGGKIRFCRGDK